LKVEGLATVGKFEELRIWQEARTLCHWFFGVVEKTDLKHDSKLRIQADGSSGSVMDNIAEGFERNGKREFIQFLSIAKGSVGEFRSQLYRIADRKYISNVELEEKIKECENLSKGISAFMNYLNKSDNKGWKFKEGHANRCNAQLTFNIQP
jgi:four helix bundle protein